MKDFLEYRSFGVLDMTADCTGSNEGYGHILRVIVKIKEVWMQKTKMNKTFEREQFHSKSFSFPGKETQFN